MYWAASAHIFPALSEKVKTIDWVFLNQDLVRKGHGWENYHLKGKDFFPVRQGERIFREKSEFANVLDKMTFTW